MFPLSKLSITEGDAALDTRVAHAHQSVLLHLTERRQPLSDAPLQPVD